MVTLAALVVGFLSVAAVRSLRGKTRLRRFTAGDPVEIACSVREAGDRTWLSGKLRVTRGEPLRWRRTSGTGDVAVDWRRAPSERVRPVNPAEAFRVNPLCRVVVVDSAKGRREVALLPGDVNVLTAYLDTMDGKPSR